jgi:hypothetical protein
VRVSVPGVSTPLTGNVVVEADPLPKFSVADRTARQAILMRIYEWTKTLGAARTSARGLMAQRDSIKADFGGDVRADSLNARITRLATEIDRTFGAVNGQRATIEGWSGMPTLDVRRALDFAIEDARKALGDLDRLVTTDIPAGYKSVAKKEWTRAVKTVKPPM